MYQPKHDNFDALWKCHEWAIAPQGREKSPIAVSAKRAAGIQTSVSRKRKADTESLLGTLRVRVASPKEIRVSLNGTQAYKAACR
jgi:hypothetical protein